MKRLLSMAIMITLLGCGWYLGVVTAPIKTVTITNEGEILQLQRMVRTLEADIIDRCEKYAELQNKYAQLRSKPPETIREIQVLKTAVFDVPISPREWQSLDEFLGAVNFSVSGNYVNTPCLWVAETLQKSLMSQGYPASIALTLNGYYYGVRVVSTDYGGIDRGHAGLLVNIQGTWYFYDPETKNGMRLF